MPLNRAVEAPVPLPDPPPTAPAALPHLSAGAKLLREGQYDLAIAKLKRALQIDPRSVEARDHLGIAYFKKGNYETALKEFKTEIRLEKDSIVGWSRVADVYYAQRDFKRTAQALESAIAIRPDMPQLHFNLGMVYQQLLQLSKAAESLQRCVELAPENDYVQYVSGNFLFRLRRLDEAERALERAISLNGQVPEYHHALGLVCLQREDAPAQLSRAERHLRRALSLGASEGARVHYDLGVCYQRQEKPEQAIEEWREAVRHQPGLWSAHYALYDAYRKLGRNAEAQAALVQFRKHRAQEDARMKRSFFHEEVERNRDDPDAYYQLGTFYLRQKELKKALTTFEKAARLTPRDVRVHRRLLELYEESGRNEEARRERQILRRLEMRGK